MSNLEDASDPQRKPEIDTTGRLFAGFVGIIIAVGALLAYKGNENLLANTSAAQQATLVQASRQ
jgi:hypothetical protein